MIQKKLLLTLGLAFCLGLASCNIQPANTPVQPDASSSGNSQGADSSQPGGESSQPGGESSQPSGGSSTSSSQSSTGDQYQVSAEYWNFNITQLGFFGPTNSLKVNMGLTMSRASEGYTGIIENAYGKLHMRMDTEEGDEFFVEPLANDTFNFYLKEDGVWQVSNLPNSYLGTIQQAFTEVVRPWVFTDFTYNPATHAYERQADSFVTESGSITFENIAFKFENNVWLSLTYDVSETDDKGNAMSMHANFLITDWGQATVEFPTVNPQPIDIPVTAIRLDQSDLYFKLGDPAVQLHATIVPENATNQTIEWASDNERVAVVSNGSVLAMGLGCCKITASIGDVSATCRVTVNPGQSETIPVSSIGLNKTSLTLSLNDTPFQLVATVYPEDATDKTVSWRSYDAKIATVENGLVTPVGVGETTIYATAGKASASCLVKVIDTSTPARKNPYVGVTLQYKANSISQASYSYTDPTYTAAKAEAHMATVTISMFDDGHTPIGVAEGDAVTGASFEMVSKAADGTINYVYLGEYDAYLSDNYNQIDLKAYYSGKTGRWYHGTNLELFHEEAFVINGGFHYDETSGEYRMSSYINGPTGTLAKGNFAFVKANEAPVHVADLPTDNHDDDFLAMVEKKVFVFSGVTPNPATMDPTIFQTAYAGSYITFFENQYAEFHADHEINKNAVVDAECVYRGSFSIVDDGDNPGKYLIKFAPYDQVIDGEVNAVRDLVYHLVYDSATQVVTTVQNVSAESTVTLAFSYDAERVPTQYVVALPDRWEADKVSAALSELEITDSLPAVPNLKTFTISAVDTATQSFTITGVFASRNNAMTEYRNYSNALSDRYGFSYQFTEDYLNYYVSPHAQFEVWMDYASNADNYGTLTMTIKKHVVIYPEAEINALIAGAGYTDPIINFRTEGATQYQLSGYTLMVSLNADTSASEVIAAYAAALAEAKYGTKTYKGNTYYFSEHEQIGLLIIGPSEGGANVITISFVDPAMIPDTTYPTAKVQAALAGVTDTYPSFAVETAESYQFLVDENYLSINLTGEADIEALGAALVAVLVNDLHYTYVESFTAVKDAGTEEEDSISGYGCYLSPNRQCAFFLGFSKSYPTNAFVQIYNLVGYKVSLPTDAPEFESMSIEDYTDSYTTGQTFAFDGTVTAYYKDGTSKELSASDYTISDAPDMSTAGEYKVKLTYVYEGKSYTETFTVTVEQAVVMSELLVEDYTDTYTVGDTFAFDGTVTVVYSDGDTKVLAPEEYTMRAAGATDRAGSFTVTFVYTENGKNIRAEITITVEEAIVVVPEEFTIENYTDTYTVGDHFEFNGTVTMIYSDGFEKELTAEDYTITGTVNTAEAGEYKLNFSYTENGVTVTAMITITVEAPDPVEVEYVYQNTTQNWIANDNATFKVWAWGGEYGEGAWVDVVFDAEAKTFTFSLYNNCDGFQIVRFNEAGEVEWNRTSNMTPTLGEDPISFSFPS